MRDDWKSITMEFGVRPVLASSTIFRLALSAEVLDLGWCYFLANRQTVQGLLRKRMEAIRENNSLFSHEKIDKWKCVVLVCNHDVNC